MADAKETSLRAGRRSPPCAIKLNETWRATPFLLEELLVRIGSLLSNFKMFPTEILYMLASILVVTHTVSSHPHRDEINTSRHRRIRPAAGTVSRDALGELDSGQLDEARQAREQEILADRKLKLLRIEQIKMEILKKLGMTEAPNVTESFKRFPTPFLMSEERNSGFQATDGYLDEDDDSDYRAKTLQVSFFAENSKSTIC